MRLSSVLLLSGLTLLAGHAGLRAGDEAPTPTQLVDLLGSSEFAERQDAARSLDALGEKAVAALKVGCGSTDMEVRRRSQELLEKIQGRIEAARAVSAKKVQLNYKEVAVTEAVADFSRKAGIPIELNGDTSKLTGRKITLDTGSVSFWEALDKFCDKAGLVEIGLQKPAEAPKTPQAEEEMRKQVMWARGGQVYYPGYQQQYVDLSKVVLVDGKQPTLPAHNSTSVRVRVLPNYVPMSTTVAGNNEKTLPLEVLPEPGMPWLGMLSVRIDRATDEHNQSLVQPALFLNQSLDPYSAMYGNNFIGGRAIYYDYGMQSFGNPNHAAVRLRIGEKPPRTLKEVQGVVTCQAQSPVEPLMTVDNVMKSAGTTVDGPDGGSIKVLEVKREPNADVKMKVLIQPPSQEVFDAAGMFGGQAVRINRAVMQMKGFRGGSGMVAPGAEGSSIELRDEKGKPLQMVVSQAQQVQQQQQAQMFFNGNGGVAVVEQELLFRPNSGQAAPAKLVYIGRRTLTIDVPFTLKDVPLQ